MGAVAKELFPQINTDGRIKSTSFMGITIGFSVGLLAIYILDYVIAAIEKMTTSKFCTKYPSNNNTPSNNESSTFVYRQFQNQHDDMESKEVEINSDGSHHHVLQRNFVHRDIFCKCFHFN